MKRIGFDNDKYLSMQSAHIRERISQFGDKLYLEFGGKLFDDYHASRVLPGFAPDSKLQMLLQLADQAEMIISINAADIERNKIRHDLGITYDQDVIRLIDVYQKRDFMSAASSLPVTQVSRQQTSSKRSWRILAFTSIIIIRSKDIPTTWSGLSVMRDMAKMIISRPAVPL